MNATTALVSVLLTPFFGGVGALLATDRWRQRFSLLVVGTLFGSVGVLGFLFQETFRYEISGWSAPLGIDLHVDGLSVAMLLLTGAIMSSVAVYSSGYYRDEKYQMAARGFWPLLFMLWGALNAVFIVSDLFTMYVCLELVTFASVALITIAGERETLGAALSYLMTALLGSLAYLLGVALIYAETGVLDWTLVHAQLSDGINAWGALSLMTIGLIIKAALYPLHFWLPGAHAIAPAPVSALLSALVVKAPFYIMLRLWIQVFPDIHQASHVIGVLASGAVIWGSFQAIIQERIKLMVAYSTVAQIGYLFLVFPLLSSASNLSDLSAKNDIWEGAIYFVLSHGVAKAAMFLVAGIFLRATKTDHLKDMQGAAARVPVAILVWGLAGISIIGLPPSGGFIAKWQLLTSAIRLGQWPYAAVILFGGLLASGYVFRVLWHAFLSPDGEQSSKFRVPWIMVLAAIFLGILIVVMGIRTADVLSILQIGSPFMTGRETP